MGFISSDSENIKGMKINPKQKRRSNTNGLQAKANKVYTVTCEPYTDVIGEKPVTYPALRFVASDNECYISLFAYLNGYVSKDYTEVITSGDLVDMVNASLDTMGEDVELSDLCKGVTESLKDVKFKCSTCKIVAALSRRCEAYRFRYCEFTKEA